MLFSEPKIPQSCDTADNQKPRQRVSVLFSEPKIPQTPIARCCRDGSRVSVLFSEPKIPQIHRREIRYCAGDQRFSALQRAENSSNRIAFRLVVQIRGFSALQRAENSSKPAGGRLPARLHAFQCSSASRKFLKSLIIISVASLVVVSVLFSEPKIPQTLGYVAGREAPDGFSALQRAENSSKAAAGTERCCGSRVSVLFSEPKIPQTSIRLPK